MVSKTVITFIDAVMDGVDWRELVETELVLNDSGKFECKNNLNQILHFLWDTIIEPLSEEEI